MLGVKQAPGRELCADLLWIFACTKFLLAMLPLAMF